MNIAVFFGGKSPEHEVSIITGQLIISELRKTEHSVTPVYISKEGKWFAEDAMRKLDFFTKGIIEEKLKSFKECMLKYDSSGKKMILVKQGIISKEIIIDLVFPAFHGMNGEDGTMQGVFELANVPYVGCGVAASAMTMDKVLTKKMYESEGIPTTKFVHFNAFDWKKNKDDVVREAMALNFPLFVKPARLGSSIGIAKVKNENDLIQACEVALHYDSKVIVEESVENMVDITCAVMGQDEPIASLVQESVFNGEHFSFEAKYLEDGGAQLGNATDSIVIPARLNDETTSQVREMAIKVYRLFDCAGLSRIDFLYDKAKEVFYVNEVNTMPGTLYHHLWKASGIEIGELIEKLLSFAIEKHKEKNEITFTFKNDVLKFANSVKLKMGDRK